MATGVAASPTRDPEGGRHVDYLPLSQETLHRVGQDAWYEVGFHIIAALNSACILGYPALVMGFLGWIGGPLCMVGGAAVSFYNNWLLGGLYEFPIFTSSGWPISGPLMYKFTWLAQYTCLIVDNIGTIILAGQSVKAIATAFSDGTELLKLPGWIAVTGAVLCIFVLMVPTLHALRFFSTISLVLNSIYTFNAIAIAFNDGM